LYCNQLDGLQYVVLKKMGEFKGQGLPSVPKGGCSKDRGSDLTISSSPHL